jgi:adenine-specific DNA-methyltransferase
VENLKKVCTEIYGEQNFIGILSVENNPKGRKNSSFISVSSEYCMIYAKNKSISYFIENVPKQASDMTIDENGRYVHNSGKRVLVGENSFNHKVSKVESDKNYSVYYRKNDNSLITKKELFGENDNILIKEGYKKFYSFYKNYLVENTYTETKLKELHNSQALDFSNDKIYEKNFNDTIRIKSLLVNKEYDAIVRGSKQKYSMELTTTGAGTIIKDLFKSKDVLFTAPKNPGYIKLLISLIDSKESIILDFFSGSATTAHAVMKLNAEDGGNRKFIMVQLPEKTDEKSEAYKAGYKNICEIGKERIRRAGKKVKEEAGLQGQNLDTGFRVLKLDSSNMEEVYYTPQEFSMASLFNENVKADRSNEDLLFQVMLDLGIELSAKIESKQIAGKQVHIVDEGYLVACFDRDVNESTIIEIAKQQPVYFVMRDASAANDNVIDNFEQIFRHYSPDTTCRII